MESRSALVATSRHRPTWAGPLIHAPGHHHRRPPPILLPLPLFDHRISLLCSAPIAASPIVARHRQAAFELSDRTKRSAPLPCPSCVENLHVAPASEAGQWEFPCRRLPPRALHQRQPPPVVPRPHNEFCAAKELLPDHFSGPLDHSFIPSPASPSCRHTRVVETALPMSVSPQKALGFRHRLADGELAMVPL
jgi:hypothetical protein